MEDPASNPNSHPGSPAIFMPDNFLGNSQDSVKSMDTTEHVSVASRQPVRSATTTQVEGKAEVNHVKAHASESSLFSSGTHVMPSWAAQMNQEQNNNTPYIILQLQRTTDVKKLEKKTRKYKQDDFPDIFGTFGNLDNESRNLLFCHFPPIKFAKKHKKKLQIHDTVTGPYDPKFVDDLYTPWVFGRAISTYPHLPTKDSRDGDPICDSYCIQLLEENITICVVADGCNWGPRPMAASNAAKAAFTEYLRNHIPDMSDLRDVGHYLLQALSACQHKIVEGKEQWEAGTTTLLGGMLIPVKPLKDKDSKDKKEKKEKKEKKDKKELTHWVWAFVSIGDCKSYHYSQSLKKIEDLTEGNRQNVFDAKDCGGRLGPQLEDGGPDLRNVSVHYKMCEPGDIVLILSDGVHDNLDPQTLGKTPAEVSEAYKNVADWNMVPADTAQTLKTDYMLKLLSDDLICGGKEEAKLRTKVFSVASQSEEPLMSPGSITTRIIQFCLNMTGKGREWMEQNPQEKLPNDYTKYPGKMDHATCVTMKVGKFDSHLATVKKGDKNDLRSSSRSLKD